MSDLVTTKNEEAPPEGISPSQVVTASENPILSSPILTSKGCYVEKLNLYFFRNYDKASVQLGPKLNLITGNNGQGKTNLLEAIATVALTKSPKASSSLELIKWENDACRINVDLMRNQVQHNVDLRFTKSSSSSRVLRSLKMDGNDKAARDILGKFPVVLFWPDDLMLVKGSPEGRRRFLDLILTQLDYHSASDLARYSRIVIQRNALLRRIKDGHAQIHSLDGFNQELIKYGAKIQVARALLVEALAPFVSHALQELSKKKEIVSLKYVSNRDYPISNDFAQMQSQLTKALQAVKAEELARGMTAVGPHRDNLDILFGGHDAKIAASQGQQRSIVLSLKLAEVAYITKLAGIPPLLLLDDVLSELDSGRRYQILKLLGVGQHSQTILTTTEVDVPELSDFGLVNHLEVENGKVDYASTKEAEVQEQTEAQ